MTPDPTQPAAVGDPIIEQFAALSHEQWSGWYAWMAEKWDQTHASGETFQNRWQRQAITPYADLSEAEKESDRIEARKMLGLMSDGLKQTAAELARHATQLTHDLIAAEQRAREAEQEVERVREDLKLADADSETALDIVKKQNAEITLLRAELSRMEDGEALGNRRMVEVEDEVGRLKGELAAMTEHRDFWRGYAQGMEGVVEAAQKYRKVILETHGVRVPWEPLDEFLAALAALDKRQVRMAEVEGVEDST